MATEPVVHGRAAEVCVAVSTVVAFGTVAIFLYPALYHLNERIHLVSMTPFAYGIFAGSTVHEVAQVVAAGKAVAETAANTAVITKLVRVMMLAPFLVLLSGYLSRSAEEGAAPAPAGTRWRRRHSLVCPGVHRGGGIEFDVGVAACLREHSHRCRYARPGHGHGRARRQYPGLRDTQRRPQTTRVSRAVVRLVILGGFAINTGITALLAHGLGR